MTRSRDRLPSVLVAEIPPVTTSDYLNLGAVKTALGELEQGKFQAAADLVDAMWRDDRIPGVVETRIEALHGLDMHFDPPEGDEENARAKELAEAAARAWTAWIPEDAASDLRRWGLMLNMGVARIRWDTTGETWEPRIDVFHPRNVRWSSVDDGYLFTTQQGEWLIRRDERGIVARTPDGAEERNGWIVYTPYGWRRGWMRSLVRSLACLWLFRQWALRDWSAHSEAHGTPSKKAFVPNGTKKEDKRKFLRDVALLVRRSAILLERGTENGAEKKPGFDVELLEAAADSHQVFEKLKTSVDTDIAIRVKGTNLTTEVKGGSLAATSAHRQVDQEKLRFDAAGLATCVHDQVVVPWAEFNFAAPELAPWPSWDTEPPEDLKSYAETLDKVGDALKKLGDAAVPVDGVKIAERIGIPLRDLTDEGREQLGAPQILQYHLEHGIPTENEVRKRLRLPPRAGGDRPTGSTTTEGGSSSAGAPPGQRARSGAAAQALAAMVAAAGLPPGAIAGQLFNDKVVDQHGAEGAEVLRLDVDGLLAVVRAATGWEDLRDRLVAAYGDMDPEELQGVIRNALILAELNGQLSAREDM
jgi:phage gp29-like protein